MNVYVESNFVLELALRQEQSVACSGILELCDGGDPRLVIPSYCLAEPYETLTRRHKDRTQLRTTLQRESRQLVRTSAYVHRAQELESVMTLLATSSEEESDRLDEVRLRLLETAEIIPLEGDVLASADLVRTERGLAPKDAIVYASVLSHLRRTMPSRSCFLNRDLDFEDLGLTAELERHGCKLIPSFEHGDRYIRSVGWREEGGIAGAFDFSVPVQLGFEHGNPRRRARLTETAAE